MFFTWNGVGLAGAIGCAVRGGSAEACAAPPKIA
jgi:hypothetical protein